MYKRQGQIPQLSQQHPGQDGSCAPGRSGSPEDVYKRQGLDLARYEKTAILANYPPACDFLNVCLERAFNCGTCLKLSLIHIYFGTTTTDIVFDGKNTVDVTSNNPYSLVINGKKYAIKPGTASITLK